MECVVCCALLCCAVCVDVVVCVCAWFFYVHLLSIKWLFWSVREKR